MRVVISQWLVARVLIGGLILASLCLAGSLQGHTEPQDDTLGMAIRPLSETIPEPVYVYTAVSSHKPASTYTKPVAKPTAKATSPKPVASSPAPALAKPAEPVFETPQLSIPPETIVSTAGSTVTPPPVVPASVIDPSLPTKTVTQTIYEDLPAIWVFPVPNVAGNKAFGDAAWSVAADVAHELAATHPNTRIYYPSESLAILKRRQPALLNRLYEQWLAEGHFQSAALAHAVDVLSEKQPEGISRVVVVQADTDLNQPEKSWNLIDKVKTWHGDDIPNDTRMFLRSRIAVIDTQAPDMPQVWTGAWQHPIKRKTVMNMTSSVYADSDSVKAFHDAGQILGKVLLVRAPKTAFYKPVTVTTTQVIAKRAKP